MTENDQKSHTFTTRFAPSPTGGLHMGHAYSALLAFHEAQKHNGRFLLRIEDIDTTRCKPEFIEDIYRDLEWLGLRWEAPVRCQSQHFTDFQQALDTLKSMGVIYPCFCTRKEIQNTQPQIGPEGIIYPGTCKHLTAEEQQQLIDVGKSHSWRLNLDAALEKIDTPMFWRDQIARQIAATPELLGDVILARKDTPTSYHLSVVVDDALQNITHVIRGKDLWHATHIHVVLQALLKLPQPQYWHHDLLLDESGEKFAKRNKSMTLKSIREGGTSVKDLYTKLGF
ncbi:tRNA glutamyl-Q(34) synthetase GluQRS [Kordiimonas sp. SCSIO 12603]|uniref:tRNA glutamyl-Q(34) synthetase GluQRS n=1 Tax=Kordiimonas sp. SCSIO 12603 TaxID=2829596 RepID=UPI0021061FED|nr:tRNA glutamyl-Q(34) synthetase GluQRS [Kordiimonas sp. SCSIO 12603]UTW58471.1 tRNA glutamyl-Q(34) synthetase GluQRS [Kordiimonas sp. SCSIO 12603]